MLEIKNVSASYEKNRVLHNISFQVPEGKNLIIIGPNGCGKTTLLKAIAGVIKFEGDIVLNNISMSFLNRREKGKKMAFMSQFSSADFDFTIWQTIMLGRYAHQQGRIFRQMNKEDKEMVEKAIKIAGLTGMEEESVLKLSGGQLQRVFFARALAQNPNLILLDEPTNHLDLKYQTELLHYVKDWSKKEGNMAIGVFHDLNQALLLGDYVVALKEGRVVAQGEAKEIITPQLLRQIFDMDVSGYMLNSLKKWEQRNKN